MLFVKTIIIKPLCIWLTGLSGSGKSSIAKVLQLKLMDLGVACIHIDGDEVRELISADLKFSKEDRIENARRIAHIGKLIYKNNFTPIISTISPYIVSRDYARSIFPAGSFIEVYVNASIEICKQRDPKKLYDEVASGAVKNFTGIDMPYELSDTFDIEINTDILGIKESVDKVLNHINTNLS